jgi:serine O-acetyltransferase
MFGLLHQIARDARELVRAVQTGPGRKPESGVRNVLREAVANDSFQILFLTRVRERARRLRIPGVNHVLRRVQTVVYGLEIGNAVTIGEGVWFVHPIGTVVGGDARVGSRVKFMGNNTIGTVRDNGCPTIEDDVTVGAGARILGPVRVGAGAVIGANAVVLEDVPAGATVVGIPARPVGPSRKGSSLVS